MTMGAIAVICAAPGLSCISGLVFGNAVAGSAANGVSMGEVVSANAVLVVPVSALMLVLISTGAGSFAEGLLRSIVVSSLGSGVFSAAGRLAAASAGRAGCNAVVSITFVSGALMMLVALVTGVVVACGLTTLAGGVSGANPVNGVAIGCGTAAGAVASCAVGVVAVVL